MNFSESDHPDLTAYALGELDEPGCLRIRKLLAGSPEARLELEHIQHTVSALKQVPAMPRKTLSARQRETVIAMSQIPMRAPRPAPAPVPFKRPSPRQSPHFFWTFAKLAAAMGLGAGVFFIGQKSAGPLNDTDLAEHSHAPTTELTSQVSRSSSAPIVPTLPSHSSEEALRNLADVFQTPMPAPIIDAATNAVVIESTPPSASLALQSPRVTVLPAEVPSISRQVNLDGFTSTANTPEAVIAFNPRLVKPAPVAFSGVVAASMPVVENKNAGSGRNGRPENPAPLVVHSWKAEMASCPWNPNRRLMRFVAQIPLDQDAMDSEDADYKLVAKFDPNQVEAYRLVTEKHMPPSAGGKQATRFAWYEIIPGRNFHPTQSRPAMIGSMEIVQPRGASKGDATPLKLVDRGQSWKEAREDFVFETAMVGFNQLLQGMVNADGLNHNVVLELAEKTKGADANGERARFIESVKQAQGAAGL